MGPYRPAPVLGELLRGHRVAAGFTQQELAHRAGVSVRALRDLERGRLRQPRARSVGKLAEALELSPAEREALLALLTSGGEGRLRIGVLGPLAVSLSGIRVDITSQRQRTLLGLLALYHGQTVPISEIIDVIWGEDPPRTARNLVQKYVGELRTSLGTAGRGLRSVSGGYALDLADRELDLLEFDDLVARAHAAHAEDQPESAAELFTRAVRCWRGPVLSDTVRLRQHPAATAVARRRIAATVAFADVTIRLGAGERGIAALRALAHEEPLHEGVHGRLMLALAAAGEQAEALRVFAEFRSRLGDELGVEPGPEVQAIHLRILRGQAPENGQSAGRRGESVPRQLPAPPQLFTGRTGEVAVLDQVHDASTVVISAIDGMAGVGKTALAVHVAHRTAHRYPDGQLFIDLHGYTPGVEPIEPAQALDHALRALGIPGAQIPAGLDERAGLYRTRLADQRMLIVLDNAATEAQVAPLLPGAAGCLVVVTSRRRLAGLDHTCTLSLDTLPVHDAVTLFTRTVGEGRLTDQPPGLLAELVELCGRLPLAIRIAAARLRSHPTWELSHLVARLRDQQHRLGELEAGQRSVAAALDLSYRYLRTDLQHTYRLLGRHPGPTIDSYATAALLDSTLGHATRMLDALLDAHLLQEPTPGRYRFHDLTRAHASHTATGDQTEATVQSALTRLLDHYRHTAALAMDAAYPYERMHRPQVPPTRTPTPKLPAPAPALRWLDTELPNLLATARYATEHGTPEHIWHLSSTLHRHLRSRGRYHDAEDLHHQALTTARAAGHRPGEEDALIGLGHIHRLQCRHAEATDHFGQALQIARTAGHRAGELDALNGLGHVHRAQGRYAQAIDHYQQVLQIARTTGHRAGELDALNGLGHIDRLQCRHAQAIDHYQQVLQIARTTGHRRGELAALNGLGHLHRRQGQHKQAADYHQQLLDLAKEGGDRNWQFEARQGLGRLRHATGDPDTAITHHDQALALARELEQPDDQARAHDGLAHAHHTLNQHQQAREHWQHALTILTDLGIDHTDEDETTVTAIRAHLARWGFSAGGSRTER